MTGLVDTLERDGLVTREHDSGDRRMMLVHLTPKGHATLQEILPGHFKQMAAQMAPLSEHERKTLVRLLNKVAGLPTPGTLDAGGRPARRPRSPSAKPSTHLHQPMKRFLIILGLVGIVVLIVGIKVLQISTLIHIEVRPAASSRCHGHGQAGDLAAGAHLRRLALRRAGRHRGRRARREDRRDRLRGRQRGQGGRRARRQDTSAEAAQLRSAEANVELTRDQPRAHPRAAREGHRLSVPVRRGRGQREAGRGGRPTTSAPRSPRRRSGRRFPGGSGIRLVNLGQNLKAGDPIVSLQALDPIFVDFYLPQQELRPDLGRARGAALGRRDRDGPVEGKITAINPDVDAATRNVRIQATVQNPRAGFIPGCTSTSRSSCRSQQGARRSRRRPSSTRPMATRCSSSRTRRTPHGGEAEGRPAAGRPARRAAGRLCRGRLGPHGGRDGRDLRRLQAAPGIAVSAQNDLAPDAQLAPEAQGFLSHRELSR